MNTFERELRKLFDNDYILEDIKFIGRSCYGRISDQLRVRAEFIPLGFTDRYEALKVTIINRHDGVVDTAVIRFGDLFGLKKVNNPNFSEGIIPYIWRDGDKTDWYVYHPTPADYEKLSDAVSDYVDMFCSPTQAQPLEMNQQQG